nr:PQQ-dependent sugar dehydrogenase [Clostridium sp. YIM B02506]
MYNKGNIFYISGNSLFQYNIKTEEDKELLSNLPNSGEYPNSKLAINEDKIYISIGAATNSGVAEDGKTYDLSPIKITLKGKNFDGDKTGAFVEYGTKTSEGQVVKAAYPGNASIITYNINNSKSELFAWGIRNIKGWDFYSSGELFGIVGGMENRGLRPIKSDVDYIYNIKKGYWYGWPDYSGGDPVNSARFNEAESEKTTFLLDKHPTVNPEAPFYQSERIDSLQALTIDKQGDFSSENAILFFDKNEKRLVSLTKDRISSSLVNIKGNGEIIDIEKFKDRIFMLEKNEGIIYEVYKENKLINTFSQRLLISIISILLIFIITIIIKVNLTKEVK